MASVGLLAGLICFALLLVVFRREIPITFRVPVLTTAGVIKDKFGKCALAGTGLHSPRPNIGAIYDSTVLGCCLVLLSTSSWTHLPIWAITLASATLILARDLLHDYRLHGRVYTTSIDVIGASCAHLLD
jgi:hypothetical protein